MPFPPGIAETSHISIAGIVQHASAIVLSIAETSQVGVAGLTQQKLMGIVETSHISIADSETRSAILSIAETSSIYVGGRPVISGCMIGERSRLVVAHPTITSLPSLIDTEPAPPIIFPPHNRDDYYQLAAGQIAIFPFTLLPNGVVDLLVVQSVVVQDWSVRCHVSGIPNGAALTTVPYNATVWSANRVPNKHVTVFDGFLQPHPPALAPIPLGPGNYFLNIENLSNRASTIFCKLTIS